jgi:hypothetical protein
MAWPTARWVVAFVKTEWFWPASVLQEERKSVRGAVFSIHPELSVAIAVQRAFVLPTIILWALSWPLINVAPKPLGKSSSTADSF